MSTDYLDYMETEIARALRAVDRAVMFAQHLQDHPPENKVDRLEESIRRVRVIRDAIQNGGIALPPLRSIQDRGELLPADLEKLTVTEIAIMAGLNRSTVSRRLQGMTGPIGSRYRDAIQGGRSATYTLEEAQQILQTGGGE
jgi:DNA-directed RNA polymerase specialized sigma24 family protein